MSLNPADLAKMASHEVAGLSDIDPHSVRDEGFRRHDAAVKKLASLQKQIAKVQTEMRDAEAIINAALREIAEAA